jgi:hypothetical protein
MVTVHFLGLVFSGKDIINMATKMADLVRRDPALAILMGAASPADFGAENSLFAPSSFGADFGYGEFGDENGGYFGADTAIVPGAGPAPRPTAEQAINVWNQEYQKRAHTAKRTSMLEPNKHSDVKVEMYLFPLAQNVVVGTATNISLSNNPDVTIRPQRCVMNSPVPGFITISEIRVANVAVTVGGGSAFDAYFVSAVGVGVRLDMPTLSPANRATVTGVSTTLVPQGYVAAATFPFSTAFIGPAQMAG